MAYSAVMRALAAVTVFASFLFPIAAQQREPIIDMHMHADLPPHDVLPGTPALCRPEPCQGTGRATANHAETLKKSLEAMDRYNIVKAFLSGVDPAVVQQWVAAAPERFIAAPFILQPGKPDLETLRRAYAAGRFSGMGEIATQLTGVPPNDPTLEPYFALAEERDLPVLIHTLGIGPYLPGFRSAMGSPLLLEEVPRGCVDHQLGAAARGFLRLPAGIGSGGSGEAGDVRIGSDALAGEDRRSD